MAGRFEELLASPEGLPGLGPFDAVYREVQCRQGQPDFIALRTRGEAPATCPMAHIGLVGSSLLSRLKPAAPRTLEHLIRESEFSPNSTMRSLVALESSGLVKATPTGSYVLGESAPKPDTEIWAFELKLKDARRAVFQAQQARAYADRVFVVVPPSQVKSYGRFQETLMRWRIGLASFEPGSAAFSVSTGSRRTGALSMKDRFYALSKAVSE